MIVSVLGTHNLTKPERSRHGKPQAPRTTGVRAVNAERRGWDWAELENLLWVFDDGHGLRLVAGKVLKRRDKQDTSSRTITSYRRPVPYGFRQCLFGTS
jgi:hypothetical protein